MFSLSTESRDWRPECQNGGMKYHRNNAVFLYLKTSKINLYKGMGKLPHPFEVVYDELGSGSKDHRDF